MATPRKRNLKKTGRPSSFRKIMIKQARDLVLMGFTHKKVADFFGTSESMIYKWKSLHPPFKEAMNTTADEYDSKVVRSLFESATGYSFIERKKEVERDPETGKEKVKITRIKKRAAPNPASIKMWLYNRRPQEFKPEPALSIQVEGEQLPPPPLAIYYSVKPPVRSVNIIEGKDEKRSL